jgi:hypothetical protein
MIRNKVIGEASDLLPVFAVDPLHKCAELVAGYAVCVGHADIAFLEDVCRVASHCQSTPAMLFRAAAAITPFQCRGEMLSRSLIWRAASYPQPTSLAKSPMVSQRSMRLEMEVGVLLMVCIVQKVLQRRKAKSYTLHDNFER